MTNQTGFIVWASYAERTEGRDMTIDRFDAAPQYATMRLTTDTYHIACWVPHSDTHVGKFGGYWLPLCNPNIVPEPPDDPDAPTVDQFDKHPNACGRCVRSLRAKGLLR